MIRPLTNKFISFQEFHVSRSLALTWNGAVMSAMCIENEIKYAMLVTACSSAHFTRI